MKSRKVSIELHVHKIHLRVEFPYKLTFSAKFGKQQIKSDEQIKLDTGEAIFLKPLKLEIDVPYDSELETYLEKKGAITIFILSNAIGKNIAGVCNFQWTKALQQHMTLSLRKSFERCPDKQAEVQFNLKASLISQQMFRQLSPEGQFSKRSNYKVIQKINQFKRQPLNLHKKSKTLWNHDHLTVRNSPVNMRNLNQTIYTPITSRIQETVRKSSYENHHIQTLKFEIIQKDRLIKRLQVQNQNHKYQTGTLKSQLQIQRSKSKPRQASTNRQNERLRSRCTALQQVIEELKQFRLKHQKDTTYKPVIENKSDQNHLKIKHLEDEVNYYKKSKQNVEKTLKQHIRECKQQNNQLQDLKDQIVLLQKKIQTKDNFFRQDQKKYNQKLTQSQKQKYKLMLEMQRLRLLIQQKQRKANSASLQKNKFINSQKKKLIKKNNDLKHELDILTRFKDHYASEIHSFNLTIQNLKIQKNHMNSEIQFLKNQCQRLKGISKETNEDKYKFEITIKSKHQQIQVLTHKIKLLEIELASSTNDNQNLSKINFQQKQIQHNLTLTLNEIMKKQTIFQTKNSQLQEQINYLKSNHQKSVSGQQTQRIHKQELIFQNKLLKNQIQDLEDRIQEIIFKSEHDLLKNKSQIQQLKQKWKKVNQINRGFINQQQTSSIQKRRLKDNIIELEERQKLFKQKNQKYERSYQELRTEIFRKQQIQIQLQGNINRLQNQLKTKQIQRQKIVYQKQQVNRKFLILTDQYSNLEQNQKNKQNEMLKLHKIIKQKDDAIQSEQNKVKQLQKNLFDDMNQKDRIKYQTQLFQKQRLHQKTLIQNLKVVNQSLKQKNESLSQNIMKYEIDVQRNKQDILKQLKLISQLQRQIQNKTFEFEQYQKKSLQSFKQFTDEIIKKQPKFQNLSTTNSSDLQVFKLQMKVLETIRQTNQANSLHNHDLLILKYKLQETLENLKIQNLSLHNQIVDNKQLLVRSEKQVNQLKKQVASFKTHQSSFKSQIQILQNKQKQFEQIIFSHTQKKQLLEKQINLKEMIVANNIKQIKQLNNELELVKNNHQQVLNALLQEAHSDHTHTKEEYLKLQQILRSIEQQKRQLIQTADRLKLQRDQYSQQKYHLLEKIHEHKLTIQSMKFKQHQLFSQITKLQSQNCEDKLQIEHIENIKKQLQEDLQFSQQKRFKLIKQNQQMAMKLIDAKNHIDKFEGKLQNQTDFVVTQIDKLRKQRKQLDNKYYLMRKQSSRKYKDMEIKEQQIQRMIRILKQKQQIVQNKITKYNQLKHQKENDGISINITDYEKTNKHNNKLETEIGDLNEQIRKLKEQLFEGKQQYQSSKDILLSLNNQITSNKQLLEKALQDFNCKQQQIHAISRNNLKIKTQQLQSKQDTIKSLKRRLQSIQQEKKLQQKRYSNLVDGLQYNINNLNLKLRNIQQIGYQQKQDGYRRTIEDLEQKLYVLTKQKQNLQSVYGTQNEHSKRVQQESLKRFQGYIDDILKQKQQIFNDHEQTKAISLKTKKTLQGQCSKLQKQLSDAQKVIHQLRMTKPIETQGATYFMKSINQFEKVSKDAIDKFIDIQKTMQLTPAQKIKIVNKLRQFALLLLRCKTKNLQRVQNVKQARLIVDQYKLLQNKINDLVEYSFAVFQVQVPSQFNKQINNAMQQYGYQIAQNKSHGENILLVNPAQKLKRFHRSISLINKI